MKYTTDYSGIRKTSGITRNSDFRPQSANEKIKFRIKPPTPQKQKGAKIAGVPVKQPKIGNRLVKLLGILVAQGRLKKPRYSNNVG